MRELAASNSLWYCPVCNVFPFSSLENDELIQDINVIDHDLMCLINNCRNIDINPVFNENENNFDIESDPDANCLSKISSKCEY